MPVGLPENLALLIWFSLTTVGLATQPLGTDISVVKVVLKCGPCPCCSGQASLTFVWPCYLFGVECFRVLLSRGDVNYSSSFPFSCVCELQPPYF